MAEMIDGVALRDVPVQRLNKIVMETDDPDRLQALLDEEKKDGRRRSAMHRRRCEPQRSRPRIERRSPRHRAPTLLPQPCYR